MLYLKSKLSVILTFVLLSACGGNSLTQKPDVDAGVDQVISAPTNTVWLTGSVKIRALNAKIRTVRWTQISGPEDVIIINNEQSTAAFDLPATAGVYQFELTVTDNFRNEDDDSVSITITEAAVKSPSNNADKTPNIGVQSFVFNNNNIASILSPALKDALRLPYETNRELMVKIWYPAKSNQDEDNRHNYGFHTTEQPIPSDPAGADYQQALAFFKIIAVKSHSFYQAAPTDNTAYPVVFYSHGYGGVIEENQSYFEALVKQGYVVVSIGHTGEARYLTVSNGVGVGPNLAMAQHFSSELAEPDVSKILTPQETNQLATLPLGSNITSELLSKLHYTTNEVKVGRQEHRDLWVEDTHFVLNQLKQINSGEIDSNLKGIFNLSKLAASGHSFGGAIASRFCNQEINCLASINIDGATVVEQQVKHPNLIFRNEPKAYIEDIIRNGGEEYKDDEAKDKVINSLKQSLHLNNHAEIQAAQSDLYILSLKNTSHSDFVMGWFDLHTSGLGKSVLHTILEQSSIEFLNYNLKSAQHPDAKQKLCQQLIDEDNLIMEYAEACL